MRLPARHLLFPHNSIMKDTSIIEYDKTRILCFMSTSLFRQECDMRNSLVLGILNCDSCLRPSLYGGLLVIYQ